MDHEKLLEHGTALLRCDKKGRVFLSPEDIAKITTTTAAITAQLVMEKLREELLNAGKN